MAALALKELREIGGIAALAVVAFLALVAALAGWPPFAGSLGLPNGTSEVPFTGRQFMGPFMLISIVFALALGFRQSAWESGKGTYLFLLHRPVARTAIFRTKLVTGIGALLVVTALPIVLYGWWASVPGNMPAPFEWSMTAPAWQFAFLMPLVHLGAFLSGLRPARWFGSRLFPLVACGLGVGFLVEGFGSWPVVFLSAAILYVLLVTNIAYIARVRDYA